MNTIYSNGAWALSTFIGGLAYGLVDKKPGITKKLYGNLDWFLKISETRQSEKPSKLVSKL